jgi:hypothetical protein
VIDRRKFVTAVAGALLTLPLETVAGMATSHVERECGGV